MNDLNIRKSVAPTQPMKSITPLTLINGIAKWSIIDLKGRVERTGESVIKDGCKIMIDVSNILKGHYLICIDEGDGWTRHKRLLL